MVLYGRTKGLDLSEEGRHQAQLLSEFLADVHVDEVFSSPLERALQTAQTIAQPRGLDVTVREELIDTHNGTWTNLTLAECATREEWKVVQQHPTQFTFPDGESFVDVLSRMDEIVRSIVSFNEGKNIVIACHRDPIILLLAHYMGLHMDLFQRVPCSPASVSEVRFTHGIAKVESINVVPNQRMV
jgi:broad specificity phosphatase PhoE